jgi:hypothetical protein
MHHYVSHTYNINKNEVSNICPILLLPNGATQKKTVIIKYVPPGERNSRLLLIFLLHG